MIKLSGIKGPAGIRYQSTGLSGHDRFPITVERILVPTDFTAESGRAVEYGLVLAQRFGAHLTLLHVYKESYAIEYLRGPHACDAVLNERIYFKKTLKAIAEEVGKRYADCGFEFRDGVPCEEIVTTAKEREIDLIVISTHHYNWLTRLAYGCDAEQILRHAPCPILLLQANKEEIPMKLRLPPSMFQ
jgi:nucleotide-binding universal stress UspA family protein